MNKHDLMVLDAEWWYGFPGNEVAMDVIRFEIGNIPGYDFELADTLKEQWESETFSWGGMNREELCFLCLLIAEAEK